MDEKIKKILQWKEDFPAPDGNIHTFISKNDLPLPRAYNEEPDYLKWLSMIGDDYSYYENNNSFFNKIHYSGHKKTHQWAKEFVKSQNLGLDFYELDIGCGMGAHQNFYLGHNRIGLDFSKESLKRFPDKSMSLFNASVTKLPLKDSSIDIIYSIYSLEHFYHLTAALSEIARVLKPNGRFFAAIPSEGGLAWNLGRELTSKRYFRKKGVDYDKVIKLEHCNKASEIMDVLTDYFAILKTDYFPFSFIKLIDVNLVLSFELKKI